MRDRRIGKLSPALFPLTNRGSGYLSGDDRKGTKQIRDTYRRLPLPGRTGHTGRIFRLYHRLQCFPPFPETRETDLPFSRTTAGSHSGFYTQDEAREIVRYAADRFITVVPEIDLPGHTTAALASYPELGCTGGPYKVLCSFGVFPDVLCAGNDQTLQFTKDVLDEIMDIFPSEYIHIGGDECPKSRWEKCPKCQAKIKELGIKALPKHSKENQLQTYFMSELEKEINAHGRRMLGWDEVLEGGLTPNSTIMSWRGIQGGIEAARQHHDVIMTPIQRLYFSNPRINKMTGFEWMNRVYNFEPVPAELTDAEKKFVIGTQGCIWTEWTADSTKMEWQILPRMAALSEIQWTLPEHKNFERFMERLPEMLKIYSSLDYGYREDVFAADTLKTHK